MTVSTASLAMAAVEAIHVAVLVEREPPWRLVWLLGGWSTLDHSSQLTSRSGDLRFTCVAARPGDGASARKPHPNRQPSEP